MLNNQMGYGINNNMTNQMPDTMTDQQMNSMPDTLTDDQINQLSGGQTPPSNNSSQDNRGLTGNLSDILRTFGFGAIPDAGAALESAGQNTGNFINGLLGRGQTPNHNDFQTPQQQQSWSNPLGAAKNITEDVAGLGTYMVPEMNLMKGAGLLPAAVNAATRGAISGESYGISQDQGTNPLYPIGGAILGPLGAALKSGELTQKGVNAAMDEAKNESVTQGLTKTWDDLQTEANQVLNEGANQFKPELKREVQKIFATKTPAATTTNIELPVSDAAPQGVNTQILQKPELDANNLHDFRKALDDSIPQNAWNNPNIRPIGVQANQLVRQIVSNALHEVAPKTQFLDNLNHLYYKAPFSKVGLPKIGSKALPKSMAGVPGLLTNIVGAAAADKIMKAVTGKGI